MHEAPSPTPPPQKNKSRPITSLNQPSPTLDNVNRYPRILPSTFSSPSLSESNHVPAPHLPLLDPPLPLYYPIFPPSPPTAFTSPPFSVSGRSRSLARRWCVSGGFRVGRGGWGVGYGVRRGERVERVCGVGLGMEGFAAKGRR